jgi:hypothetical protein
MELHLEAPQPSCLRVHRTVWCAPDSAQSAISFHLRHRQPLSQPLEPSIAWHTRLSGAHQTVQ